MSRTTKQPEILRARLARMDYEVLKNMRGEVAMDLFPGARFLVNLKSAKNYSTLHTRHARWVGGLSGDSGGSVSLSIWEDKYVFAEISIGTRRYRIRPASDSLVLITQYDPAKITLPEKIDDVPDQEEGEKDE